MESSVMERQPGAAAAVGLAPRPQKVRPRLWIAFLMPVVMLCASLLLYGVRYGTNDDAAISNLAAGAFGPDRVHLVYVNILLGWLLRPLYALYGGLNWYMILQLALTALCCGVMLWLLMGRLGTVRGAAVFFAAALPFVPALFYSIQYVKTSALCAAAGLLLVTVSFDRPDRRTVLGIFLVWMGAMLRWDMFCAAGGLFAAVLLGRFFRMEKAEKRRAAATVSLLLLLAFASRGIDLLAYRLDEDWNAFARYNAARMEWSDFKVYQMPEGNPFGAEGISDTDLHMLLSWDFYDGAVFPAGRLQQLADAVPGVPLSEAVKKTLRRGFDLLHGEACRYVLALTILLGVLFLRFRVHSLAFWGTGALLGLEIFYLSLRGRFPNYVETALLLCAVPAFCAALAQGSWRAKPDRRLCAVCLAGLVLCAGVSLRALWTESRYYHETRADTAFSCYEQMSADKEHLYLLSVDFFDSGMGYDVWHARPEGFFSNIVFYGGWLSHAPCCEEALAAYGVDQPLTGAVDNDAVFVGVSHLYSVVEYASEHAGRRVEAVESGEIPPAYYQLRTADGP